MKKTISILIILTVFVTCAIGEVTTCNDCIVTYKTHHYSRIPLTSGYKNQTLAEVLGKCLKYIQIWENSLNPKSDKKCCRGAISRYNQKRKRFINMLKSTLEILEGTPEHKEPTP